MDDGVLAGPRAALCRALTIYLNVKSCSHSLNLFPSSMMSSDKPNLVILGAPIGDNEFCSSFVFPRASEMLQVCGPSWKFGLIDPQDALILLCLCGAFASLFI